MATKISLRQGKTLSASLIEVDGQYLSLRLPRYFGRTWWRIPLDQVSVVDHESAEPAEQVESDFFFPDGLSIPYLATASARSWPNLSLLFTTRQRVPPLRMRLGALRGSPLRYRASRSAPGDLVDGIQLRVVDPDQGVQALANAGLEVVRRPVAWLRERRWTSTDLDQLPAYRAAHAARRGPLTWALVGALLMGLVFIPDIGFLGSAGSADIAAIFLVLTFGIRPGLRRVNQQCEAESG